MLGAETLCRFCERGVVCERVDAHEGLGEVPWSSWRCAEASLKGRDGSVECWSLKIWTWWTCEPSVILCHSSH